LNPLSWGKGVQQFLGVAIDPGRPGTKWVSFRSRIRVADPRRAATRTAFTAVGTETGISEITGFNTSNSPEQEKIYAFHQERITNNDR
jgi:hypothetical protein